MLLLPILELLSRPIAPSQASLERGRSGAGTLSECVWGGFGGGVGLDYSTPV